MINRQNFLNSIFSGISIIPLDYYLQWLRQSLYPHGTIRLGHILETYLEPVIWIKIKEILFGNIWFLAAICICGVYVVARRKILKRGKMGWGMWIGPIIGLFIYTWQLASVPPGVYVDEAVTGYNAYSLLMTGKDEYGKAFPILIKYFGSWLPGLNMYLLVPVVKVLGLTELAVRLPAALLGVLVILVMYALIKLKTKSESAAVWGAVFMAITPWMVFNARLGYEEMIGFILFAIGCGLLERSIKLRKNLWWAITAWSLASYTAHVFRYLMILAIPVFLILNFKELRKWPKKFWLISLIWLTGTQVFNLMVINTPAFWVKQEIYNNVNTGKIISNFWGQLTTYLSPVNLFVKIQDIDMQHQIPMSGLFYWWMIVPVTWGFLGWIKNWKQNKWWLALTALGIIPAAMSGVFISVQRALPLLLPLTMAMAEGIGYVTGKWGTKKRGIILGSLAIYSGLLLFRSYFVLLPGLNAEAWNYGYKDLSEWMSVNSGKKVVVDNSRNTRSYILPLFYLHYPPGKLQAASDQKMLLNYYYSWKTEDDRSFGNWEFRGISWKEDQCKKQILAGDELAISEGQAKEHMLTKIGEVRDKTGKLLLQWWETNPEQKCKINL